MLPVAKLCSIYIYFVVYIYIYYNLCGTHQIKLPNAMKLQPLLVYILAHRQTGGLSGNVNKKGFNRFGRGKPIIKNVGDDDYLMSAAQVVRYETK